MRFLRKLRQLGVNYFRTCVKLFRKSVNIFRTFQGKIAGSVSRISTVSCQFFMVFWGGTENLYQLSLFPFGRKREQAKSSYKALNQLITFFSLFLALKGTIISFLYAKRTGSGWKSKGSVITQKRKNMERQFWQFGSFCCRWQFIASLLSMIYTRNCQTATKKFVYHCPNTIWT